MSASPAEPAVARNVYLLHGHTHAYEIQSRRGNPACGSRPIGSPSLHGQYSRRPVEKNVPTFSKDVAPIIFKNCAGCHRPGEIAPMSLLTYEEARPWAKAIRDEVGDRHMPPWHADAPAGTFHNERLLSDADRATLIAWANGGAPKGDPAALPPTPTFPDGWSAGKPDVVLEMTEAYKLPADGTIEYEYFYIPTNFTEPKWVKSIEIRPGNREVVHHVLVYYRAKPDIARTPVLRPNEKNSATPNRRTRGKSPRRTDLQDLPQRLIATYAPGTTVQVAPRGHGVQARAGRHLRTADALHDQRRGNERSHEGRHHVLERAVAARDSRRPVHQRRLHAAGRQPRRRRDRGRRVRCRTRRCGRSSRTRTCAARSGTTS